MSDYQCSCYWEYPNPMHRHNNGKWKCVDNYEKCEDWQPKSIYSCKTHCRRKEVKTMDKEYMFEQLLSLEMANTKLCMQILACLVSNEQYAKWESAFDSIEKKFFEIIKQLHKENE